MSTLIYSPTVEVHIQTEDGTIYDVSADIIQGSLTRVVNGVSQFQITLQNGGRKYDGVFKEMDKVAIYLTRIRRLLILTGYLDMVPAFSAYPADIILQGSCTMKRLQYWYWDPTTSASNTLLNDDPALENRFDLTDGGLSMKTVKLLNAVAGWPTSQIHIGAIPQDWFKQIGKIANQLIQEANHNALISTVGSTGILAGNNPQQNTTITKPGIGPGTGQIPNFSGFFNIYSSQEDHNAVDPKSATPSGDFFATMRWPYLVPANPTSGFNDYTAAQGADVPKARKWWMGQKLLLVNPQNNKAVVVEAAGWGPRDPKPGGGTDTIGSTSAQVLTLLGAQKKGNKAILHVAFAPSDMKLGLVKSNVDTAQATGLAQSSTGNQAGGTAPPKGGKGGTAVQIADAAAAAVLTGKVQYIWGGRQPGSKFPPTPGVDCLPGDSIVHTTRGPIPIREIEPGDMVFSFKEGKLVEEPVVAWINKGEKQLYKVRTRNRSIRGTANHPVLTAVRKPDRQRDAKGRMLPVEWETRYTAIDQLKRGDIVVCLDHLNEKSEPDRYLPDGTLLDRDVAWLLGIFTGDGHVDDKGFSICVYGDERERVREVVERVWGLHAQYHESHGVRFSSTNVARTFKEIGLREYSSNRRVPEIIRGSSTKLIDAFLEGYTEADGSYSSRTDYACIEYKAASQALIQEIHALHIELGHAVSTIGIIERTKEIIIKGRVVAEPKPLHCFEYYPEQSQRALGVRLRNEGAYRVLDDNQLRLEKVLGVEEDTVEETFDIEVANTHNFISNGIFLSNCSGLVMWATSRILGHAFGADSRSQAAAVKRISLAQARKTKGALLFLSTNGTAAGTHHVGISMGDGTTAEARTQGEVSTFSWASQNWSFAGLIPGANYAGAVGTGTGGVPGKASNGSIGGDLANGAGGGSSLDQPGQVVQALFNIWAWPGPQSFGGDLLGGVRATMNDIPILQTVDDLMSAGMRQYCSAPNGDFIGWFPDYFGWWGTCGKMVISDVEIVEGFAVARSDVNLKTHWFVTGSNYGSTNGGDATAIYQMVSTAGIATVEYPDLMKSLFKVGHEFDDNGQAFLFRHGARPMFETMTSITGHRQEFFFACFRFMLNWSSMWTANLQLTFMPELYPGMLVVLPTYGVQAYVQEVRHDWNLSGNSGFTTSVSCIAWSTIGPKQGFEGLPQGALIDGSDADHGPKASDIAPPAKTTKKKKTVPPLPTAPGKKAN